MISIVSVVFKQELSFLKMQARSIELYVKSSDINSIIVVVNDSIDVLESIDVNWYGINAHKVKLIHFSELIADADLTLWQGHKGWYTQQICKVLAASIVSTDWSMILDAKTLLILPLDKLITADNKAWSNPIQFQNHFLRERDFIQNYFNVDFNNYSVGPGGVPFVMHTATATSMINYITERSGTSYTNFFLNHLHDVTEFLLYSGYVLYKHGSYDAIYQSDNQLIYNYFNISDTWDDFDTTMHWINVCSDTLTMSLHRRTYPLLSDDQKNKWVELLYDKGLIDSVEITKNELNTILTE